MTMVLILVETQLQSNSKVDHYSEVLTIDTITLMLTIQTYTHLHQKLGFAQTHTSHGKGAQSKIIQIHQQVMLKEYHKWFYFYVNRNENKQDILHHKHL